MIQKETVKVEVDRERIVAIVCDICKQSFERVEIDDGDLSWPTVHGNRTRAQTAIRFGETWCAGEFGGSRITHEWHICPKCFQEHLYTVLEGLGAKPTTTEIDW